MGGQVLGFVLNLIIRAPLPHVPIKRGLGNVVIEDAFDARYHARLLHATWFARAAAHGSFFFRREDRQKILLPLTDGRL